MPTEFAPRVVLAAKPCDSAALAVVDKVMNWDYQDELWNGRREATTIVNLACPVIDESCFCTAVGTAPDDAKGADALLTPVEGGYLLEVDHRQGARPGRSPRGPLHGRDGRRRRGAPRPAGRGGARRRPRPRRRQPRDRRRLGARLDRHALRRPAARRARRALQRLRRLLERVPHLSLLRHRRRGRGHRQGHPAALLGHLPGADLHPARQRPQPARQPEPSLSPAHQPQVLDLPAEVRRGAVHGLRPLHARLPRRPGPRRDPPGHRHRRAAPRSGRGGRRRGGAGRP